MPTESDRNILRRFLLLSLFVALAGGAVAFIADRPSDSELDYADATREIGGALVAGAVVAGLVLWFEERREDQRQKREEAREDRESTRAWRRELDFRLITLVSGPLAWQRDRWRGAAFDPTAGNAQSRRAAERMMVLREGSNDVAGVLAFLRSPELDRAFRQWELSLLPRVPSTKVAAGFHYDLDDEDRRWDEFISAVMAYRDSNYPL